MLCGCVVVVFVLLVVCGLLDFGFGVGLFLYLVWVKPGGGFVYMVPCLGLLPLYCLLLPDVLWLPNCRLFRFVCLRFFDGFGFGIVFVVWLMILLTTLPSVCCVMILI